MILPNVRSSFGRDEAGWLVHLLGEEDEARVRYWEALLAERGIDAVIDDHRTLECILRQRGISLIPPTLSLYVLVRHALLQSGIGSRTLADYLTALILEFGYKDRSTRIAPDDSKRYHYLVDILEDLSSAEGRRAFLLRVHLGNFALWLSGLFPDYIVARVHRRGAPGLDYYDRMGTTGFRLAADDPHARRHALDSLYHHTAESFGQVRRALNRFSDRFLFPHPVSPVDRFLRQVANDFLDA
ncbi:MAG: hypothetical protein ACE5JR_06430 [Gemmatimonadota bacterium]